MIRKEREYRGKLGVTNTKEMTLYKKETRAAIEKGESIEGRLINCGSEMPKSKITEKRSSQQNKQGAVEHSNF